MLINESRIELRKLSVSDGRDVYDMLQEIPRDENGFVNNVNGKTFEEFKGWLSYCDNVSKGIGLQDWMVPQDTYWLYVDSMPVGVGKLRHYLTDKLMIDGGHAGCAVRYSYRNKGYGTIILKELMVKASKLNISDMLVTVQNHNLASIKVALKCGGQIEKTNDVRHYIWIKC